MSEPRFRPGDVGPALRLLTDAFGRVLAADAGACDALRVSRGDEVLLADLLPELPVAELRLATGARRVQLGSIVLSGVEHMVHAERFNGPGGDFFLIEFALAAPATRRAFQVDPVTGLADRSAAEDWFAASHSAGSVGAGIAVLFIDLDGFKQVNDNYGHAAGDQALRSMAARLRSCVRESDLVCRWGGDEFVVLLAGVASNADVAPVVERLRAVAELPLAGNGRDLKLGASVGVAIGDPRQRTLEELIAEADRQMYAAKRAQRS